MGFADARVNGKVFKILHSTGVCNCCEKNEYKEKEQPWVAPSFVIVTVGSCYFLKLECSKRNRLFTSREHKLIFNRN